MKKIKHFELDQFESNKYKILITFRFEEDERDFIKMLFNSMNSNLIVAACIQDLETDIELYKQYFIESNITVLENRRLHPIIVCQKLDAREALNVIDNFGYYTIDARLFWSKTIIDIETFTTNSKNENYMLNYSELVIRQVLDLSLSIRVNASLINEFMRLLVEWSI